jgi:hypothetical protein
MPMPATRKAVSYKRLLELETQLRAEVEGLFALGEQSEQPEVPDGLVVREEMARRQDRLVRLAATFCSVTRSSIRGCESSSENGVQAQDRLGQSDRRGTHMHSENR